MRFVSFSRLINWKYAVGEVLLITIGILIALAASDWQSEREARQSEIKVLRALGASLTTDLQSIESLLLQLETVEIRLQALQSHLRDAKPYDESLDALFGLMYGFGIVELNTAVYESLKSTGLGLISDDELRYQLTHVYEHTYPRVAMATTLMEDIVLDVLRPYFLEHFRDLRIGVSATPVDSVGLMRDQQFRNLVDYKIQSLRQAIVPRLRSSAAQIGPLIDSIRTELANRPGSDPSET